MTRMMAWAALMLSIAATTTAAPATRPSAEALHAQAVELMRQDQLDKALEQMDKAYAVTPATERNRPLVLNRAILDLRLRLNVMRAVRELHAYLVDRPEPDEEAHNILGAALNVAAASPRVKNGAVWQAAFREWERRNDEMDASRPGFRRWGAQWLSEQEYEASQDDRVALQRAADEQQARVDQAQTRVETLRLRHQALVAADQAERQRRLSDWAEQQDLIRDLRGYEQQVRSYETQKRLYEQWLQRQQQLQPPRPGTGHAPQQPAAPPPAAPATPQAATPAPVSPAAGRQTVSLPPILPISPATTVDDGIFPRDSKAEQARIASEFAGAMKDLQAEQARLGVAKRALQAAGRPRWPTTFEPIDLAATTPPSLPPPDPEALAARARRAEGETERGKTPFADSGVIKKRQPFAPLDATAPTTAPADRARPVRVPFGDPLR